LKKFIVIVGRLLALPGSVSLLPSAVLAAIVIGECGDAPDIRFAAHDGKDAT
jgi:hypothetical protein